MKTASFGQTIQAPITLPQILPLYNIYWPRYSTLKHIPIFSPFTMSIGHIPTTSSNSPPVQSLWGYAKGHPVVFIETP